MKEIHLPLERSNSVIRVGAGVRAELPSVLPSQAKRAAIVTQANIPWEVDPGIEHEIFCVPDSEEAKSFTHLEDLCRSFATWGLTRKDVVVGLGGGVVTDLAGFAAAVYHRGMAVVHVPTTLLGQIDAAVGGKVGVNIPEGKNLAGAFWQPDAVLCDLETLSSLSPREFRNGCGEVAKYFLLDNDFFADEFTGESPTAEGVVAAEEPGVAISAAFALANLEAVVARCVEIKARIVVADEREGNQRVILNYGHTLAHALEAMSSFTMSHGEAVAVGLIYAAEVAGLLGRITPERVAEHRKVVSHFGLPSSLAELLNTQQEPDISPTKLLELFGRDKKSVDQITLVLDGPNGVEPVAGVPEKILLQALPEIKSKKIKSAKIKNAKIESDRVGGAGDSDAGAGARVKSVSK